MGRKKKKTPESSVLDRKIGATLAFIRRRDSLQSQKQFAERLGISRGHLANVEAGKTPLSALLGWVFCKAFDCDPTWIVSAGKGPSNVFPRHLAPEKLARIEAIIKANRDAPFRDIWPPLAWFLSEHDEMAPGPTQKPIDNITNKGNIEGVKERLPELLARLKRATQKRGKKAELARYLGVALPKVSRWLSGKPEPGGETTLRLLSWVEQQERQR